jgi:hypothetical protein
MLYCTTSHCLCHSVSCTNHVRKLTTVVLIASFSPSYSLHPYSLSSPPPASSLVLYNLPLSLSLCELRSNQEKIKLRLVRPGARDVLDVSDATCLTRTRLQWHCASGYSLPGHLRSDAVATAYAYWTRSGSAFCFWTQPCQGIFLLDAAVSGEIASGQDVSWHHGHAGCHGTEPRNVAGSKHSDSI